MFEWSLVKPSGDWCAQQDSQLLAILTMTPAKPAKATLHDTTTGSERTYDHVLVISNAVTTPAQRLLHQGSVVVNARFDALSAGLLAEVRPDCVLAPLFGIECDLMDVAARLTRLGFRGLLLGMTGPLPNPRVIKAEVRGANPDLTFDLIEVPDDPRPS